MLIEDLNPPLKGRNEQASILVIEDDLMISELLESFFDMNGYNCTTLSRADDIFQVLSMHKPDLLIIDYMLPGPDGGTLCRKLKDNPSTSQLPVLLYSALPETLLPIESFGCDAFLAKPFSLDDLGQLVQTLLSKGL
ncbi:response regulator [Pedobacter sp. GR22-6]|uniref:response regulator n=1 Tax=Pedobacter sp. GR22-6 TaxID=3127957 RepID=UPI00307D0B53